MDRPGINTSLTTITVLCSMVHLRQHLCPLWHRGTIAYVCVRVCVHLISAINYAYSVRQQLRTIRVRYFVRRWHTVVGCSVTTWFIMLCAYVWVARHAGRRWSYVQCTHVLVYWKWISLSYVCIIAFVAFAGRVSCRVVVVTLSYSAHRNSHHILFSVSAPAPTDLNQRAARFMCCGAPPPPTPPPQATTGVSPAAVALAGAGALLSYNGVLFWKSILQKLV